ncbi:protein argonaute-2 isoform X2 [Ooceraea biroi]|uniref:protein argonaute-2 isoform X2 n=1 Tax=Ooceraea biroi TaxID=2015173 RepID=UPI0005B7D2FD|nr:protein argonaute-2 isoform X2 [Ooceraea biroi]
MTRKGKKKKQQNVQEGASTSGADSDVSQSQSQVSQQQQQKEQPKKQQESQKQTQKHTSQQPEVPQQQQVTPGTSQQQGAWAARKQQQQTASSASLQQQQQVQPQQQQQARPPQAQQPQQARLSQQQHVRPPQPPAQQPQSQQAAWGPPQAKQLQQAAWGPPQQQQIQPPRPPAQQSQQAPWGPPQQQQIQPPRPPAQQSQQAPWGPPQQQQVRPPQAQQPQQAAWGPPQQQQVRPLRPPVQQPQQAAWGPPQQPQPAAWGPPQQQQAPRVGPDGDQPSVKQAQQKEAELSSQVSQLALRDTLESTQTTQKGKLTSSSLKQYHLSIPKRNNPKKAGTQGIPTSVWTNMFQIIFNKNFVTNAVHYDVAISPIAPKSLYREVFEQCRTDYFGNRYPAFDGKKNAYSANNLPFNDFMEAEIEIYDSERDQMRKFKIELKKVANIDLSWITHLEPGLDEADRDQTAIQVLDIIMRHAPQSRNLSVGRSLHWKVDGPEKLGEGLTLSRGGFQSAVLGWKPFLNVDVCHKGFPTPQNVIDLIGEFTTGGGGGRYGDRYGGRPQEREIDKKKVEKYLKGLKVNYQIPNQPRSKRTYRVNGLGAPANVQTFSHEGVDITVANYFSRFKNYNLSLPNMPVICVGPKERNIALPAELCTIVAGQSVNRKLSENQVREMIKQTTTDAPTRKRRIEDAFARIQVNESNVMKNEFHLSVQTEMKKVPARVLPPPQLQYAKRTAIVNKGVWQPSEFNEAMHLENYSWTILNLTNLRNISDQMQRFSEALQSNARGLGMSINQPLTPFKTLRIDERTRNYDEIKHYFNSCKKLKLVIVVISDRTDTIYSKVKQITELEIGVLTQCVKLRNVEKCNPATVKNILLKINSKLNGINHKFLKMPACLQNNSCMLVGADVTHPSPDAINIPSIAAVAASSTPSAFQYNIELRLQQPKEEMIMDLENIIISQILIYGKMNNRLPNGIIYYRDGVSEGQLGQVMYYELNAIKRACARCKIKIPVTCLVVQKRHHVRFFPTDSRDTEDFKNKNVRAGTIVDTEITHPNHIDFYLVSHASIQGTARPTKYRCICNEAKFTEDHLEELTYYLCHMYARCTRAVSYPAPTYYAHLAAYRGRALIQEVDISLQNLQDEQNKLKMNMAGSPMCFI